MFVTLVRNSQTIMTLNPPGRGANLGVIGFQNLLRLSPEVGVERPEGEVGVDFVSMMPPQRKSQTKSHPRVLERQ